MPEGYTGSFTCAKNSNSQPKSFHAVKSLFSLIMPLLRGFAVPFRRLLIALLYPFSSIVHNAKVVLGIGKPLLRSPAAPFRRLLIALLYPLSVTV